MTPFEAATAAVRSELNKIVHDPREIARQAVKAYLEVTTKQLASTGDHELEDLFAQVAPSQEPSKLSSEPQNYRMPAVFCNESSEQANNVVQVTVDDSHELTANSCITVGKWPDQVKLYFKEAVQTTPVANTNCWTSPLLDLIKDDEPKTAVIPSMFIDIEATPLEPFSMSYTVTQPVQQPAVTEREVIIWIYKELVEMGYLRDNDVLDLSRTPDETGLDSLDVIELVIAAEYEFDIEISDEAINAARNLQDMVTTIVNLRSN